ncbi:MAG: hypothetical protein WCZ66_00975 [Sphingomonadaceae bacterium]
MDRVRTGLTGLGLVFLFTLLASVLFSPTTQPGTGKETAEPLAQLGVAPGADKASSMRGEKGASDGVLLGDRIMDDAVTGGDPLFDDLNGDRAEEAGRKPGQSITGRPLQQLLDSRTNRTTV